MLGEDAVHQPAAAGTGVEAVAALTRLLHLLPVAHFPKLLVVDDALFEVLLALLVLFEDVHSAAHFLRADFRGHELQFLTPHINFPFHSSCTSLQNKWVSLPIGLKKAIVARKCATEGKKVRKFFAGLPHPLPPPLGEVAFATGK